MRIGIITIHKSPSYGACLQSYALFQYLKECGYDVEIIDLHRPYQEEYVPSKKYVPYPQQEKTCLKKIKECVKNIIKGESKVKKTCYLSKESKEKFKEFNDRIKYSRPYYSIDDLYSNPPVYDVYLTGSDQVWNPTQPYCIEPYFLTFAPNGKKRLSYAASLGQYSIPDRYKFEYTKWLKLYDAISVRESQTASYLSELTGLQINTVVDPTFLLGKQKWEKIAVKPVIKEPYILYFALSPNIDLLNYAIKISKESGIRLINFRSLVPEYYEGAPYTTVTDAGPCEFLGYMGCAEMVITNSFHGSAISLLMGAKNLFTYIPPTNTRGVRIEELFRIVGYEDHILYGDLTLSYKELCAKRIDHEKVNLQISRAKEKSCEFLLKNL